MGIRDWFGKPKPKPELDDAPLRAALRQQVMSDLSRSGGLNPVYRNDVASEEDFEARQAGMPLVVVWNERDTPQGLAFSMSVNGQLVAATIERYVHRQDPWFDSEHHRLVGEIKSMSMSAMLTTVEKVGAPPSQICGALP